MKFWKQRSWWETLFVGVVIKLTLHRLIGWELWEAYIVAVIFGICFYLKREHWI